MRNLKAIVFLLLLLQIASAQSEGDSLFAPAKVHTIQLTFSQGNYWSQLTAGKAFDDANDSSTYIPASVTIDGTLLDSIGVQLKGNSSYYNYPGNKKPFTLSFDEYIGTQRYNGLKNINLNNGYQDPTLMREKMFLDFLNEQGLYAPRSNYAKLYINGTYWGLYLMVERVDKNFVKNRDGNKQGNLFKGDKGTSACATLQYHGVMSAYYNCYDLKTNTTANDWSDLVNLCYEIYATDTIEFKDSLEAIFNMPSFIGSWAACNLFVDFDSYAFRYPHNYDIYHNTASNKFDWITWDVGTALGIDVPGTITQIENTSVLYTSPPSSNHPLTNRLLADSFYRAQYLNTICRYANYNFLPSVLNPKIDSLTNLIRMDLYADSQKQYSNQNFDSNIISNINVGFDIPGLKSFIANRSQSVLTELYGIGRFCDNSAAPPLTCDSFCVVSIKYDTANDNNLFITVANNDTNFINYPIIQLIDVSGDTIGNQQKLFEFYGQAPYRTQTYHIPTQLDSFPSNWSGQVRLEDGLHHTACIINFPCGETATNVTDEKSDFTFKVFPNPSEGNLSLQASFDGSIAIFDIAGRMLQRRSFKVGYSSFDLRIFPGWNIFSRSEEDFHANLQKSQMDKTVNELKHIPALRFHWLTNAYDRILKLTFPEKEIKGELILQANIQAGESVLDFGIGTGTLSIMAFERQPYGNYLGVDVDSRILSIAEKKIKAAKAIVQLKLYDGIKLPFPDKQFDTVISCLVFHHLSTETKKIALKELNRVIKPGGKLIIADFSKPLTTYTKVASFLFKYFDGIDNLRLNLQGLLPSCIEEGGFRNVAILQNYNTAFGTMQLFSTSKL